MPIPIAKRIAGIAYLIVNGRPVQLRGNFTVSPSSVERTMISGQDGYHGFWETPRTPWIEADLSTMPELMLAELDGAMGIDVVAVLANNHTYHLVAATCKAGLEGNTRDGQVRVRWEGAWCEEMPTGPEEEGNRPVDLERIALPVR